MVSGSLPTVVVMNVIVSVNNNYVGGVFTKIYAKKTK